MLIFLCQALLRVGLTVFFLMVCRFLFYANNVGILPGPLFADYLWGLRFDLSAAMYVNGLLWVSYLIPFRLRTRAWYMGFQKWVFVVFNMLALLVELVDIAFFRFQNRRTLVTDLGLVRNTLGLLPKYLLEYWYLVGCFVALAWLLGYLYRKTTLDGFDGGLVGGGDKRRSGLVYVAGHLGILVLGMGIFVISARGGLQLRPLTPIDSADHASDMRLMPLLTNTTLNFIHSTGQSFLSPRVYMSDVEAGGVYPIFGKYEGSGGMRKLNVVVIALESFGKEYSAYHNMDKKDYVGYTPFLDSLCRMGLQVKQSYANGLRSGQGISAITAGLPSLMSEQFVFSPYQTNRLDGLAAHLERKGYWSAFFHGSNSGSMGFDKFANLTGFKHFFDRYGYGNQAEYDGNWGIWDEPMLQFVSKKLSTVPEPFYGFFFSLTSHHPFRVPADFEQKYPLIDPLHRSVLYADNALRLFFEEAKKQPWFGRTLFVISADHVGEGSSVPEYQTKVGRYKIPILFYKPNEIVPEIRDGLTQQQDIMPSVLDFLHYEDSFLSFGRSVFGKDVHYSFNYESGLYQIQDARYVLLFDGDRTVGLYEHGVDVFLKNNLKAKLPNEVSRLELVLKSVIQQYHRAMIGNQLTN
jgi:hypothetical protein